MATLDRMARRALALAAFLIAASIHAAADHKASDDANLGVDAGNTKDAASRLSGYGSYTGYLTPRDWDWYRVDSAAATPRCVQATASGENNDTMRLTLDSPSRTRSLTTRFPGGGSGTLAIAAPDLTTTFFDITASPNSANSGDPARPGHYGFTLASTGIPAPNAGDALTGSDAGNSLGEATPAPGPCFGGRISPLATLGDARDVYSVQAKAGEAITYSFATRADAPAPLVLALVDASGTSIGPTIYTGEIASVTVPTTGTYYLSASRANIGAEEIGYIIGIVIGPPDPGNPCRPTC